MARQKARFVAGAGRTEIDADRRRDLPAGGQVRGLRFNKGPRGRLRAGRLPDRLSQGEPSGGVPLRLDDARHGRHRQTQRLSAGRPNGWHPRPAAGREPLEGGVRGGAGRGTASRPSAYALGAIRNVGRAAMEQRPRGGPRRRAVQDAVRLRPPRRPAPRQQAGAGKSGGGRGVRLHRAQPRPGDGGGRSDARPFPTPNSASARAVSRRCSAGPRT